MLHQPELITASTAAAQLVVDEHVGERNRPGTLGIDLFRFYVAP